MRLVLDADQLNGDADLVAIAADAAFENIVDIQFTTDLANILRGHLVGHGRRTSNHAQLTATQFTETHDHFFGEALGKILLRSISTQVLEGEDGQHGRANTTRAGAGFSRKVI